MAAFLQDEQTGERIVISDDYSVTLVVQDVDRIVGEVEESGSTSPFPEDEPGHLTPMVLSPILQDEEGAWFLVVRVPADSVESLPLPALVRVEIDMDEDDYLDRLKRMVTNPEAYQGRGATMTLGAVLRRVVGEGVETLLYLYKPYPSRRNPQDARPTTCG